MTIKFDIKFLIALTVLGLACLIVYSGMQSPTQTARKPVVSFYLEIPNYKSDSVNFDPIILSVLDPDKFMYRRYYKDGGKSITVFIAYYNSLEKADLSHSPLVCFTGQGWKIVQSGVKKIPLEVTLQRKNYS